MLQVNLIAPSPKQKVATSECSRSAPGSPTSLLPASTSSSISALLGDSDLSDVAPDEEAIRAAPTRRSGRATAAVNYTLVPKKTTPPKKRVKKVPLPDATGPLQLKSELLAPPVNSKKRKRTDSVSTVSSLQSAQSTATEASGASGQNPKTKAARKPKPNLPSKLVEAPLLTDFDHGCQSDDDFFSRLHIREFVVRFHDMLYPKTQTIKKKSRGKTRRERRNLDMPEWIHGFTERFQSVWAEHDGMRGLLEGLSHFVREDDFTKPFQGYDEINSQWKAKKQRSILLSKKSVETFSALRTELQEAAEDASQSYKCWMLAEDILVQEGSVTRLPHVDRSPSPEPIEKDGDEDIVSEASNENDQTFDLQDELATSSPRATKARQSEEPSEDSVASDFDELASDHSHSAPEIKALPSGSLNLAQPKLNIDLDLSSDLSDSDEITCAPSNTRTRRNYSVDEKIVMLNAFICLITSRSHSIHDAITLASDAMVEARKQIIIRRKELADARLKHQDSKPKTGSVNDRKAWQADLDALETEFNSDIAQFYPAMHPVIRFDIPTVLGITVLLPGILTTENRYSSDREAISSAWSVLVKCEKPKPLPIGSNANKKAKTEHARAVAAVESTNDAIRWRSCSGSTDLCQLGGWLDSLARLRVYQRKLERFENDGRSEAGDETAAQHEEKAATDLAGTIKEFSDYVRMMEEEHEDSDEIA